MKSTTWVGLVAVALVLSACVTARDGAPDAQERARLSTKMVNLSSAVDTYFSDLPQAPNDKDSTILRNATQHDKRLLAPEFEPYLLKVQYQDGKAVLLLCTKDGAGAIMEDAGCSARLDRQVMKAEPCQFMLRVAEGCRVEGADPEV